MEVKNSDYTVLDMVLKDIFYAIAPLEEDYVKRMHMISNLSIVIQSIENLRGARVEPFGSFVSNLYTKHGDVDISIDLPNVSILSISKKEKQQVLREIMEALKRGGAHKSNCILKLIPKARVPLLVFESKYTRISCDISINNPLGQVKSKCLLWISQIDERFREMILLVKEWAKTKQINDPKQGLLSSYGLCLLVIFHFQTCQPAILPPLRDIFEENITGTQRIDSHIESRCTGNIAKFSSQRLTNESSLSRLFVSFFEKFSIIQTQFTDFVVSTYTGRWEPRSQPKWSSRNYKLIIEDPFERSDNAARAVGVKGLAKIAAAIQQTYQNLSSPAKLSRSSLLADLMRPQSAAANLRPPQNHNGSLRPEAAANRKPSEKHSLESPANVRRSKNKNKHWRTKTIPAAVGRMSEDQNGIHTTEATGNVRPLQNQKMSPIPVGAANVRQWQNQSPFPGPEAATSMTLFQNQYLLRPAEVAASTRPFPNQHFHRPEATPSQMLIQNRNEIHGPQLNADASTESWQNQYGLLNQQMNAVAQPPQNLNGFHNELHQAGHMNDRIMQGSYRPPHDVKRNSSYGKRVWRPVYGNNPF